MKNNAIFLFAAVAVGIAALLFAAREALTISRFLNAEETVGIAYSNHPATDQSLVSYARCAGEEITRYPSVEESIEQSEYLIRLSETENRISYYSQSGGLIDFCPDDDCRVNVQPWLVTIVSGDIDSTINYAFSLDRKTGDIEFIQFSKTAAEPLKEFKGQCVSTKEPSFDTTNNIL